MKKVIVLLPAALLALAGAMISGGAQAAAIAPGALRIAADQVSAVDKVQFVFRGRRYCWYYTGWRGPGWYWCGYRWRRGVGWGGPVGWHGWRRPGVHRPGVKRPGGNRPNVSGREAEFRRCSGRHCGRPIGGCAQRKHSR